MIIFVILLEHYFVVSINTTFLVINLFLINIINYLINKDIIYNNNITNFKNNNQNLTILIPPKKLKCPKTLYFYPHLRNKSFINNFEIKTINFNKKNKKYFVTFYTKYKNYYLKVLKSYNLEIGFLNYSHNLFLNGFNRNNYKKINKNIIISKYQKIYEYIDVDDFYMKNKLYQNYKYMKKLFYNDFNYMCETFTFPKNKKIIKNKFKNYKFSLDNLWLVKPIASAKGNGIFIFKSLKDIKLNNYIITKFITNPNLINKKKYDLRLYVLISGFRPLRIYLNKQGLVRIASEIYNITSQSIENKFVF